MNVAKKLEPVTLAEFEAMEKDEHCKYELIDGVVMMSPRPALLHQIVNGNLYYTLRTLLKGKNCTPIVEADLTLASDTFVPDLMILCDDPQELKQLKRYQALPLIVMEIISPSSSSRDYITKRYKYEALGIKEYWIVSPDESCITVFNFVDHTHEMYCEGQVRSALLPEIQIDLADIFA